MKSNKVKARELWYALNNIRKLMLEVELGADLRITQEVALCIMASPGTHLEDIIRDDQFQKLGRSTVKRAVKLLIDKGLVSSKQATYDKRCFRLKFLFKE